MDHAIYGEPPVRESARLKALKIFREGREFVGEWTRRNSVSREFARQRMPRQQPLRGVSQRFTEAVNSAMIGRNQAILLRQARCHSQSRCTRGRCESGYDQFPP